MNVFQETVTTEDNGLRWIVHSFFSEPPIGDRDDEIPVEDDTTPPTFYYNRERPSWNEVYESNLIVVYCKLFKMCKMNSMHFCCIVCF